jgi:uncharacterized protein YxjI
MNAHLNRNLFFVKEHTGIFKAANNFDIYEPDTRTVVLHCREENLGFFTKLLRFSDYKRMTPFNVQVSTIDGQPIVSVKRGVSVFRSTVEVFDENQRLIGTFQQRLLSIGGKFDLLDLNKRVLCTLQGQWTSWDFSFNQDGRELAHVSKKWAGMGKELFTSADNYMLQIKDTVPPNDPLRPLILAAVLCIDMVLKE